MSFDREWEQLEREGYVLLKDVFDKSAVHHLLAVLQEALKTEIESVRQRSGAVYAARNVLDLVPEVRPLSLVPTLAEFVTQILGEDAGLVRGLFFDKPPERTWALPWHKDLSIAAVPVNQPSDLYSPVRMKAGVPHVEAPETVLKEMLTLRIHLDPATPANGPLEVWPGSHHTGKTLQFDPRDPVTILSAAGDVLAMRPMLAHSSGLSHVGTLVHRRVLHLEFAASRSLPDNYRWHQFFSISR